MEADVVFGPAEFRALFGRVAGDLLGRPPEERVAEVLVALRLLRLTRVGD